MDKSSRTGFVHSVKVPRIYKNASVIVRKVVEEGGSLNNLVYSSGHKNIKGLYALVVETIKHSKELDRLIKNSKLLQKEAGLQPWLAKILLTELLFGKKELKGDSRPVKTILSYQKQFEKLLTNKKNSVREINTHVKKPRYVRVNTLHYTPDEIVKIFRNEGWSFIPPPSDYSQFLDAVSNLSEDSFTKDFHIKELLIFPANVEFYNNELYQNGSILLQDKASCFPAFLLQPEPNSVALDVCAAPGMKTTHLSALMRNKGKIYATEIDSNRYKVLCDILNSAGCTNVTPINIDALKLNQNSEEKDLNLSWCEEVEYILVDPSCSGSGIVKRVNVFSNEKNKAERLKKLSCFQFKLLMHSLTNFPRVKRVVYSTCSVLPEENEKVVEDVLTKLNTFDTEEGTEDGKRNSRPKFKLVKPLENTWHRRGSDEYEHGGFCIFADPKKDLTNGFFIAVFERLEDDNDLKNFGSEGGITKKERKKGEEKVLEDEVEGDTRSNNVIEKPVPEGTSDSLKHKRKKRCSAQNQEFDQSLLENENLVLEEHLNSCPKKKKKHKCKDSEKDEKKLPEDYRKPKEKRK